MAGGVAPVLCFRPWTISCGNRTGSYFTKHPAFGKDLLNTHIMIHLPDTRIVVKAWLVLAVIAFLIVCIF